MTEELACGGQGGSGLSLTVEERRAIVAAR